MRCMIFNLGKHVFVIHLRFCCVLLYWRRAKSLFHENLFHLQAQNKEHSEVKVDIGFFEKGVSTCLVAQRASGDTMPTETDLFASKILGTMITIRVGRPSNTIDVEGQSNIYFDEQEVVRREMF